MNASVFSGKIVEWYREHHRRLPWRETKDPYRIWLSEIILQQTRVAQGLPYYQAFTKKYPTVSSLAAASEQDILRLWQGLGYYSRARNLHACAKTVVSVFGGKFPRSFSDLRKLKGIGDYTAAAIASFSNDEPVAAVDGNAYRVLSRVFGLIDDIASVAGRKKFKELANKLVPRNKAAIHNQALMEFGALHCTPRNPKCTECSLERFCLARREGTQEQLPVKRKSAKPTRRNFYYFVVRQGNKLLMKQRNGKDIWQNLWDFPLHEGRAAMSKDKIGRMLSKSLRNQGELVISPVFRHALSHQTIHARFVQLKIPSGARMPSAPIFSASRFMTRSEISKVPKPVLVSRFLTRLAMP